MKTKVFAGAVVLLILVLTMSMFVFSTDSETEDFNILRAELICLVEGETIITEFNPETETIVAVLECGREIVTLINQNEADFLALVEWANADFTPVEPRPLVSRFLGLRCPSFFNNQAGNHTIFDHETRTVIIYDSYRNRTEHVASEEELSSFIDLTEWWFYQQYGFTLSDIMMTMQP